MSSGEVVKLLRRYKLTIGYAVIMSTLAFIVAVAK